jgi:hypothetical protein
MVHNGTSVAQELFDEADRLEEDAQQDHALIAWTWELH